MELQSQLGGIVHIKSPALFVCLFGFLINSLKIFI